MNRLVALLIVCANSTARADGYYYEESFGVSTTRGAAAPQLDPSLRIRLGVGVRIGDLSIEPFLTGDLSFDRDGATLDLFGGEPSSGHADLAGYGIDAKYTAPLSQHFAIYVRGGPRVASGTNALDGYRGAGFGFGSGVELVGKVRALGFLWAPLFFLKRGPIVHGALFLDQGLDVYRLRSNGSALGAAIVSTNIGFAIGTDF